MISVFFWGVVCAVFLLIEAFIPALVSIWFALAALITLFFSIFIKDPLLLGLIFSVLSVVFIIGFKPMFKDFMKTNDRLRKEEVKIVSVSEDVSGKQIYEVRYKGGLWTGISDQKYGVGETVPIKKFDGNKIIL